MLKKLLLNSFLAVTLLVTEHSAQAMNDDEDSGDELEFNPALRTMPSLASETHYQAVEIKDRFPICCFPGSMKFEDNKNKLVVSMSSPLKAEHMFVIFKASHMYFFTSVDMILGCNTSGKTFTGERTANDFGTLLYTFKDSSDQTIFDIFPLETVPQEYSKQ